MRSRSVQRRAAASVGALLAPLVVVATLASSARGQAPSATPPPTPVLQPNGKTSPSPFPSTLRTPEPLPETPQPRAAAAILADLDSGQVLFALDPRERRPIASLTKIMTALLVTERTDPDDVVTVSAEAAGSGRTPGISELGLRAGEQIRVEELLYALMLQSANDAALALAEHVSGTVDDFVELMNRRARRLGLTRTDFRSPNGLDDSGYSTAGDLLTITRAAYELPGLARIVATKFREIPAPDDEPARVVQNRNALLWLYPGAIGVKTGYTSAAGFCVVAAAERDGVRLVSVVLGSQGEVFSTAATLLNHGFAAFERRQVLAAGEPLGLVQIGGRDVPVASAGSLTGLVPVDTEVRRRVLLDPSASFPPLPGERVGTVGVSVPGLRIGRVPIRVVSVPPPPPLEDPGPWWRRAASAVVGALDSVLDALFS